MAVARTCAASACAALACAASCDRPHVTDRRDVASTRFIKLQTLDYVDPGGRPQKWDSATRTTKHGAGEPDAVVIIALLRGRATDAQLLLVQQFRPPVDAETIELPAGLIDAGETAEVAALRELKEETGYVGKVAHTSQLLAMSPGMCDETFHLCVVDVDLDAPANQAPEQALEDTEFIRVHKVPLAQLLSTLKRMEADGVIPIGGLYTLATGLVLGYNQADLDRIHALR